MGWGSLLAKEIRKSEAAAEHNADLDARRFAANQNRLERIALCLETLTRNQLSKMVNDPAAAEFSMKVEELRKNQKDIGL